MRVVHPSACTTIFVVARVGGVPNPTLVTVLQPVQSAVLDLQHPCKKAVSASPLNTRLPL